MCTIFEKYPIGLKYEACAFNQSAMHIKLSMICCFGSCGIVLFTGHFKGFKTHKHILKHTWKRNGFIEPAIFELGSELGYNVQYSLKDLLLFTNYKYSIYFHLDRSQYTSRTAVLYPKWRNCKTAIYLLNMMLLSFYGKPKRKKWPYFCIFCIMGLFIVTLSLLVSSSVTLKLWTFKTKHVRLLDGSYAGILHSDTALRCVCLWHWDGGCKIKLLKVKVLDLEVEQ